MSHWDRLATLSANQKAERVLARNENLDTAKFDAYRYLSFRRNPLSARFGRR